LDLVFESSFPLEAPWDAEVFFCKHRAIYYDAKKQVVKEVAMDIQRGLTRDAASYPYKLKRKTDIRNILVDSTRAVVVNSANNAAIFARATRKLHKAFDMPSDCLAMYPLQSHLVVITPVGGGGKGSALRTGLISPRGGPSAPTGTVATQAEVYQFKK
jgi:hypothetical protein